MSWMQKLYQTYNEVEKNARLSDSDKEKLAPLWHSPQTAHIQIILDNKGNFQSAKVLEEKPIIMLPVTEASEGRTSGLAPHALSDSLQYIAKDLGLTYTKEDIEAEGANVKKKKIKQKKEELIFNLYAKQLADWCACTDNAKVLAVQTYIQKGTVLADLIKEKIMPTDSDGQPLDNWNDKQDGKENKPALFNVLTKEKGKFEIRKALVVWAVQIPNDPVSEVWKDKAVQQSWAEYYQATLSRNFCSVVGQEQVIRTSHPAKLTYTGDAAKLISSNDDKGFTFRGRFKQAQEAVGISAEVSHKAHAALRWLIGRQGVRNDGQATVVWAISGKTVSSPLQDSYDYLDVDDDFDLQPLSQESDKPSEKSSSELDWSVNFGQAAAQIIKKKLHGFKAELKEHEQISLLMLDSTTPGKGRMALTYYQEFLPADYFDNLDKWIDDFSWYQRHSQEIKGGKKAGKRIVWPYLPPSSYAIFETVYGKAASDTLKKQLYARLLPVIAGGENVPLPFDFVQQSFQVACNPYARHTPKDGEQIRKANWERNVGVACALFKGYYARHHDKSQRRNYSMALDKENRSRDYLYGRLIAQAENLEWYALYLQNGKKTPTRATNAERYFQQFAQQPYSTWLNLEKSLTPYKNYLVNRGKDFYKQAIGEIMDLFQNEDFTCDNKLSGEFLLGYHCQKMEINRQIAALKAERNAAKNKSETQLTEQN